MSGVRLLEIVLGGVIVGVVGGLVTAFPHQVLGFVSSYQTLVTASALLQFGLLVRLLFLFDPKDSSIELAVIFSVLFFLTFLTWGILIWP